jgi:hypothetical protein
MEVCRELRKIETKFPQRVNDFQRTNESNITKNSFIEDMIKLLTEWHTRTHLIPLSLHILITIKHELMQYEITFKKQIVTLFYKTPFSLTIKYVALK